IAEAESLAGIEGDSAADDQGDTAAGTELVSDGIGGELEGGEDGSGLISDFTLGRVNDDDVAVVQLRDVGLDRQGAGILGGVEKDRGDNAADDDAGGLLVRDTGDILTH